MILADVNVLIYAFRRYAASRALQSLADGRGFRRRAVGLSPLTLSALVRVTTNPRVFREPSTLAEAFGFCDYLLAQPNCEIVEPGERHWAIFQRLCRETDTRGPRVSDAWFAALAIERGCEWITMDFARFPGLRWTVPTRPSLAPQ